MWSLMIQRRVAHRVGLSLTTAMLATGVPALAECNGDNADVNGDGLIDPLDSGYVLSRLGCVVSACDPDCAVADVNHDGVVDPLDSGYTLSRFDCIVDAQEELLAAPGFNPVGTDPLRACVGDFDGNRTPDMVIPNNSSSNVTLLFTDGQGSISGTETYEAALGPSGCVASDFDQDGDVDFVVSHYSANDLSLFQNNGTGHFLREVLPNSNSAHHMVGGDWNGDARDDLALTTSNTSADWVWIYLNNGDGGFSVPVLNSVAKEPGALAVGDFDLDADLDLVVTNASGYSARILENQGDGSFVLSNETYPLSDYAPFVTVGDLNGDGAPDWAIGGFFSHTVSTWLNDGIGSFSQCATLATDGIRVDDGALGDVDGDGDDDLWVTHSGDGADALTLFLNHGNGALTRELEFSAGARPARFLPFDLDSDGDLDAIVSNVESDEVSIHLNQTH